MASASGFVAYDPATLHEAARVNGVLEHEFGIAHTTVQFEFASCDVDDPYCVPYTASIAETSLESPRPGKRGEGGA